MWTREALKTSAKRNLDGDLFGKKWLMSALTYFLFTTLVSVAVMPFMFILYGFIIVIEIAVFGGSALAGLFAEQFGSSGVATGISAAGIIGMIALWLVFLIAFYAIIFAAYVFAFAPLEVGLKRYFLALRDPYDRDNPSISLLFSCFKKGEYMKAVKTWGVTYLLINLWNLIPYVGTIIAIIKQLQYFYVPFIVAENPDIDRKDAMEISKQMTDGDKWNIFVLQLSFIGWELVGSLIYIGLYWVMPYVYATYANLYDFAKNRVIVGNNYVPEVFGFYRDGDPTDMFKTPYDPYSYYNRNRHYTRGFIK